MASTKRVVRRDLFPDLSGGQPTDVQVQDAIRILNEPDSVAKARQVLKGNDVHTPEELSRVVAAVQVYLARQFYVRGVL